MSPRISDTLLSMLSALVADRMGLSYPAERWSDLERGMAAAAGEFGFKDPGECVRWLLSAPLTRPQIETLAGFLTVGESYFLRDPPAMKVAQTQILPELVRLRRGGERRLRIWSAGCSSGEEPYSIAIMLRRLIPDISRWQVTILATDINPAALSLGRAGLYHKWSFRGTPSWFKELYFTPAGDGRLQVAERIRRMVSFQYLNLAEDSYPSLSGNTSAMDLIFCRNVLMYFDRETVRTVLGKLHKSLADNGWLIVGPVEKWPQGYPPLEPVQFDGITCYRKRGWESSVPKEYGQQPQDDPVPTPPEAPFAPAGRHPSRPEPGAADQAGTGEEDPSYESAAELYRQGLYPAAAAVLTELSRRGAVPGVAVQMLIRSHANQGRLSEALHLCDEALKSNKLDPALHHLRAEILEGQGDLGEARVSLERAVYLDPKLVLAHFALGNLALGAANPDKARKHFENTVALLDSFAPEEILPESEGMSAARLREIIGRITPKAAK